MNFRKTVWTLVLALLGAGISCPAASLNWGSVTWMNGVLNQNVTAGGLTVNFAITGNTNRFLSAGGVSSPADTNQILSGGTNPAQNNLLLALDTAANTEAVTVTVTFYQLGTTTLQPISGLNFQLFDIDASAATNPTYIDQIRSISANLGGGSIFSPITVTGSADNVVTGNAAAGFVITGTNTAANTGTGSDQANASIDYGSQALTSFTFTYGNSSAAPANPTTQYAGLYNLNFNVVPEPSAWVLAALAGVAITFGRWVQARPGTH